MAFIDPESAFDNIEEGVTRGLHAAFPIVGRDKVLELVSVKIDRSSKDPKDIASQYEAKVGGGSWTVPVHGNVVMKDKQGKELGRATVRLMDVPRMTDRLSFIHKGQEYQVTNQWQLKPGVYARRRQNGELEARFNVTGRAAFDMTFDPETRRFGIEYKKANLPALPILRAMGVKDEELKAAWGEDIFKANDDVKRNAATLAQFHRTSTNGASPANDEDAVKNLLKVMEASKVRPEVTEHTLGKRFEHVTGEALALASKKLIQVHNGAPEDDRDAILFKTLRSTGDLLHDQIKQQALSVATKVQRQLNRPEGVTARGALTPGLFNVAGSKLFESSLANPAKQINPLDMVSSSLSTTIMGPGGIKSDMQVTDEAKMIHPSQFGFVDPLATPEGCHDPLTEVFTSKGWVLWPNVDEATEFACLIDGRLEYRLASSLTVKTHQGRMYSAKVHPKRPQLEYLVTPQHRMWVKPYDQELPFRFEPAEKAFGKDRKFQLTHLPYEGEGGEWFYLPPTLSDNAIENLNTVKNIDRVRYVDWAAFVGWFLSEGVVYSNDETWKHQVKLFQSYPLHEVYCLEIEALLARMGLTYTLMEREAGRRVYTVSRKQIAHLLRDQGISKHRFIPEHFFSAPLEVRQTLLDALLKGDGRKTRVRKDGSLQRQDVYTTTSPQLAEDVERLAATLGRATTHKIYRDSREVRYLPVHEIRLLILKEKQLRKDQHLVVENYDGPVYCATVPGGLLYVRRGKGVAHWSGNSSTGVVLRLPLGIRKIGEQPHIALINAKTGQREWVDPIKAYNKNIVLADQVTFKDGKHHPIKPEVKMMGPSNRLVTGPMSQADYIMPHASQMFNLTSALVPFVDNDSGNRVSMAVRHMDQSISLKNREAPLVQVQDASGSTLEKTFGHQIAHTAPVDGTVTKITPKGITVEDDRGTSHFVHLYDHYPLNDTKSVLHSTPVVSVGAKVKGGQLLADSNYTKDGHLALGKNMRVAYMPLHGKNFEDSFVITEKAAKALESVHLHKHDLAVNDQMVFGKKQFSVQHPGVFTQKQMAGLGDEGVIAVGAKVQPGDPLVLAMQPYTVKDRVGLGALRKSLTSQHVDKSLRWEGEHVGEVVAVHKTDKGYQVHVKTVEPMQVADKLCYDEETEVLTRYGWKPVAELSFSDRICCLVDSKIQYSHPTDLHSYARGGRMYFVETQQLDLLVTANHRMYVQKPSRQHKHEFQLVPADQLYGKRVRYKKDGNWQGDPGATYGEDLLPGLTSEQYLILLGMFLSEGCCVNAPRSGTYGIDIAQVKPEGRALLFAALDSMPFHYTKTPDRVRIHSKSLLEHFAQFGKAKDKFIPEEVFSFPKEKLEILFRWLMWGDGYSKDGRPVVYTTTSKKLADDVQRLCLHIGKAANIHVLPEHVFEQNGREYVASTRYDVRIVNSKLTPEVNHHHVGKQRAQREGFVEDYDRPVYCVTVPGHVLYVRRNGKPCWSGNSNRHGGKGVVGYIIPDDEAPRDKDGKPVDILFNPLGVGGRMNVGQILETMAGKIAEKTGKTYVVKNFDPTIPDRVEHMKNELKAHGLSDTEELFDPKTGLSYGQILTGPQHFLKLVHQADKKLSVRSGMGLPKLPSSEKYDSLTFQPAGGGGAGGQSYGQLGIYALLAHGATNLLREAMTVKAAGEDPETNEAKRWKTGHVEAWLAMQKGLPLPPPRPTFAFHRFTSLLKAAGINVEKRGSELALSPLTDRQILELSKGAVPNPVAAVHAKIDPELNHYKPIKGGLFDEKLLGGHGGIHWGHIPLAEPMPNPLFEDPIKKLTGLTGPRFDAVLEGTQRVDPKTGAFVSSGGVTGGAAIKALLARVDVKKELAETKAALKTAPASRADTLYRKARYLGALEQMGLKPDEAYVLHHVPVLPPKLRPLSIMEDGALRYEDMNGLYMNLGQINNVLGDPGLASLPDKEKATYRKELYESMGQLFGSGALPEGAKQKGILHQIAGTSPKTGLFQKGLLSPRQDATMRAVIIPGPDLHLDQVGLPRDAALEHFRPYVIKNLVELGAAKDLLEAQTLLADYHLGKRKDPVVQQALERAVAERPVLLKRDPALHKESIMAFRPVLIGGSSIKLHPLVTGGFNADHDGDSVIGPVLVSEVKGGRGSVRSVDLAHFPHLEETGRPAGKATVYNVPPGTQVFGVQHGSMRLFDVTEYSVHPDLPVWEVKLSDGTVIECSGDHSLAVLDKDTLRIVPCKPEDAEGAAVPLLGLLRDHTRDSVTLEGEDLSASRELGEELGLLWLLSCGVKQALPRLPEKKGELARWRPVLESLLVDSLALPLDFRKGLVSAILEHGLELEWGRLDLTEEEDRQQFGWLSRSVGVSSYLYRGDLFFDPILLQNLEWFQPAWPKYPTAGRRSRDVVFTPEWVREEIRAYNPGNNALWHARSVIEAALQARLQEGQTLSTYAEAWRKLLLEGDLSWARVVSAKKTDRRATMYDLTVDGAVNFLMSSGALVWDTMSVYLPAGEAAVQDALKMLPSRNIFNDATLNPNHVPTMESRLGLHRLSVVGKDNGRSFEDHKQAIEAVAQGKVKLDEQVRINGKTTTPGRILLSEAAPDPLKQELLHNLKLELGGKGLKGLFETVGKNHPKDYVKFVDAFKDLGNQTSTGMISTPLTRRGTLAVGAHSYRLDDFSTDKAARDPLLTKAHAEVRTLQGSNLSDAEKDRRAVDLYLSTFKNINKLHLDRAAQEEDRNRLYTQSRAGVKPSAGQYGQMRLAPGIMKDSKGNLLPTPITHSYGEGLDLAEYWIGSYGARSGSVKKVQEVQEPGYMTKLLQNTSMAQLIDQHDCGTSKGIPLSILHEDVVDRHLAQPLTSGSLHLPAGALLTKDVVDRLRSLDPQAQLVVRSPLHCHSDKGICQKCFGLSASGQHHPIGTNIGVLSAHALGERAVQLTLKAFHEGGAVSGRGGSALGSFQRLEQLTYLPDKTPRSAALSGVEGKVTKIEPTSTGTHVYVEGVPHFVGKDEEGRDLHVDLPGADRAPGYKAWRPPEVGTHVTRGQPLSDPNRTLVNPHRLYEATGDMNRVKHFMAEELHGLYRDEGVRRRAVETVVRAMGNVTKIEDAHDHPELMRGQFYSHTGVEAINEQRKKEGKPLIEHKPSLIGVNLLPLAATEDWMAVLNHQKLRTTLKANAALGAVSHLHGPHPIPGLAFGIEFGKPPPGSKTPY